MSDRSSRWPKVRKLAWDRDRRNRAPCHICGERIDYSLEPSSAPLAWEPDHIVPKEMIPHCRDVLEAKLMQANPIYSECIHNGSLSPLELVFLQQQTYQLYRDVMIMKGVSANQLKPVRVIDTPVKEKFFFAMREPYED